MGGLGVHFSFPAGRGGRLRDGDQASLAFVGELKGRWDPYYLQQTDQAWDPEIGRASCRERVYSNV